MTVFSPLSIRQAANFLSTTCHKQWGCRCLVRALRSYAEGAAIVEERTEMDTRPVALDLTYPTYVVWGAGTGIGKTLVSAGLTASIMLDTTEAPCLLPHVGQHRASGTEAQKVSHVLYLKPVQTGFPKDSDASFVMQQVHRSIKNRSVQATSEEFYLSNHTLQASPAVHAAFKDKLSPALVLDHSLSSQSHNPGMRDLGRYEGRVVGFDKDKVCCGEELGGNANASHLSCKTLWSWFDPVSPQLAAVKEEAMVTDITLLKSVKDTVWNMGNHHVPSAHYADLAKQNSGLLLRLQVALRVLHRLEHCNAIYLGLLVGDGKLGGISSTIAAYESLLLRGYDIEAIIVMDNGMGNEEALQNHFRNRIPVIGLSSIPKNPAEDLGAWYLSSETVFAHLRNTLEQAHVRRLDRIQSMPAKAMKSLWWPFTQHALVCEQGVTVIDSRCGENFSVFEVEHHQMTYLMKEQFDGCASWWTQGPNAELQLELAREMAYAAGRYSHVMFPENVHEPSMHRTASEGSGTRLGRSCLLFR